MKRSRLMKTNTLHLWDMIFNNKDTSVLPVRYDRADRYSIVIPLTYMYRGPSVDL